MYKQLAKNIIYYFELDRLCWHILAHRGGKREIIDISKYDAKRILDSYSPDPGNCCIRKNLLVPQSDLQIIVPVYNNESYLDECIQSILNQRTTYKYEVVVINDGSTDGTDYVLEKYENYGQVRIIKQLNRGFSGARNRGLEKINAKYIMFVDSDDRLPAGTIQKLLEIAYEKKADIVDGSVYEFDWNKKNIKQKHKRIECVHNTYSLRGQPWGRVYKSNLFENIVFPEGYWFEDTINTFVVFPNAKNIWKIPDFVYEYRNNSEGITATAGKNSKAIDTFWIFSNLLQTFPNDDKDYYDMVMRQVILNHKRTCQLPLEVQKSIFILSADLINKYCRDYKPCGRYYDIYYSLVSLDFNTFSKIAKYWMFV